MRKPLPPRRSTASTMTYLIMRITHEDHEWRVALGDGETCFEARLRDDRMQRRLDATGAVRYHRERFIYMKSVISAPRRGAESGRRTSLQSAGGRGKSRDFKCEGIEII